jgi:hypothetical protein
MHQTGDGGVVAVGHLLSLAVVGCLPLVILEPLDAPPGIGVEIFFVFREDFIKRLGDQGERGTYAHGRAVRLSYAGVPGEDLHAWTVGRLAKVIGWDGTLLERFDPVG